MEGKNIFSISREEIQFLKEYKNKSNQVPMKPDEYISFVQSYNRMIGHRLKKIEPKIEDMHWEI